MLDPGTHVALLEEVAGVYASSKSCVDLELALAPLRSKLGDASDPRVGAAIERDESLRTRRARALDTIMDGAMRCAPKDAG